jgi:hypothetical protein
MVMSRPASCSAMSARLLVALLGTALALSGCAGKEAGVADDPSTDAASALAAAGEAGTTLTELAAPEPWAVGDWFGVHVFFGTEDTEGIHYNTIVVEETSDAWVLATDNQQAAKEEAVFDLPILGEFRKADLGTSGLGGRWDLLKFPLSDGATWSSTVALDPEAADGGALELEFEATYNAAIATPTGAKAGYDIVAVDADARPVLSFDYVPAVGWFTRFVILDTTTEDPADFFISARSMGTGDGWTGTYYLDTSEALVQHFSIVGVDPEEPQAPYVQPNPQAAFTVGEGTTYLFGFVFSFSFAGAHDVVLVDPAGQPREYRSYNGVLAGEDTEMFVDEPAIPGEWRLAAAGAGVVAGGGAFLWSITETAGTL